MEKCQDNSRDLALQYSKRVAIRALRTPFDILDPP